MRCARATRLTIADSRLVAQSAYLAVEIDPLRPGIAPSFDLLALDLGTSLGPPRGAAVELTDSDHPARKIIGEHKARLRARLVRMCTEMKAGDPEALADGLFLLMEGAQVSTQSLGA